jgi:hypothetical protein
MLSFHLTLYAEVTFLERKKEGNKETHNYIFKKLITRQNNYMKEDDNKEGRKEKRSGERHKHFNC